MKNERKGIFMKIKRIACDFSVCKVLDFSQVDWKAEYCFIGKTDEENSLVCPIDCVPQNTTERDDGWKVFRIQGVLDFSLIGILSKIATLLAENEIIIKEISEELGFADAPHFVKFFKKETGMTPSQFKETL